MINVMIIGSGGREHALAWKFTQSPRVKRVFVAPGNAGTGIDAENVPLKALDFPAIVRFCKQNSVDTVVVGPEVPLCAGITDFLTQEGLRVFGPNKVAAQMEGSKLFCKKILRDGAVPTADFQAFTDAQSAINYLLGREADAPCVVKADGLAAGKGVIVCKDRQEALEAVKEIAADKKFGDAGNSFFIEDLLEGEEASVLAITDGKTLAVLPPAQDHKRAYDNDEGPNTGGMGAYSPAPLVTPEVMQTVISKILVPTLHSLHKNDVDFKGVLYAGLMIKNGQPKVLEYNVRFGDPECQPLMMRLKTDISLIVDAVAEQRLDEIELEWDERPACTVVMASQGYPGDYKKGFIIRGLEDAAKLPNVKVFHSGTALNSAAQVVSAGGRCLTVTALGDTLANAKYNAYEAVKLIRWDGAWCRKDIADKGIRAQQ